jgi:hypothetical protein
MKHTANKTLLRAAALLVVGALAFALPAAAQTSSCNAGYDDGESVDYWWWDGHQAGEPDKMVAVKFELADFGYEPGTVEITAFCAGNQLPLGGLWPNEVFLYPDDSGAPDDSVILAHGTIITGNGVTGESVVLLDEPVTLHGDFWLANRGWAPHAETDFNMEYDGAGDGGHSYISETGIADLQLVSDADWVLRAALRSTDRSYLVAGMAHGEGANSSQWRSKLALLNTSDGMASATVSFVQGSGTDSTDVDLAPGELVAWDDVAVDLFGADDSSGSIRVDADRPVVVTARTYNQSPGGTFGQFLPGVLQGETLTSGRVGVLSQLANNEQFRTNIGFINLGEEACRVEVTLYDSMGTEIGSRRTIRIEPSGWKQDNDILNRAGAGEHDNAYAKAELITEGCSVWGYASVVDGGFGDPTTIPMIVE